LNPHDKNREEERKLISLCQEGDKIAFERLYHHYCKDVFTMAIRMVNSEDIAEEVTQEVFISVFKDIRKFQFQSAFTTWLYSIVYRRAADQFRKIRKYKDNTVSFVQNDENSNFFEIRDKGATPGEIAVEKERIRYIGKAIASLSPKQRAIMVLRYNNNLSYEEIALVLKCRIGTVKSRLNRAHKTMEAKLDLLKLV